MGQNEAKISGNEVAFGVTVVNAIGQLCPIPVLRVSQAIKQVKAGDEIEVLTTDPGSKSDIPAWAKMTGNELLSVSANELENQGLVTVSDVKQPASDGVRVYKFRIRRLN